jgi:hypothetical protein
MGPEQRFQFIQILSTIIRFIRRLSLVCLASWIIVFRTARRVLDEDEETSKEELMGLELSVSDRFFRVDILLYDRILLRESK